MYTTLELEDEDNKASAKEALLARLTDTDLIVIQAIYARSDILVGVVHAEYIDVVRPIFIDAKTSSEIIKAHMGFIDAHLLPTYSGLADKVFQEIIFPCLWSTPTRSIFTKSTFSGGGLAKLELLKGIVRDKASGLSVNVAPAMSNRDVVQVLSSEFRVVYDIGM